MTPVKDHTGAVAKSVGVQLDVTATSEGLEDEGVVGVREIADCGDLFGDVLGARGLEQFGAGGFVGERGSGKEDGEAGLEQHQQTEWRSE